MNAINRALTNLAMVLGLAGADQAHCSVALPPMNLGDSTFQDGIAGPGGMFQQTLSAYYADTSRGRDGRETGSPELTAIAMLMQASYLTDRRLFGAYWGGEIIVPFVYARVQPTAGSPMEATGVGDVFISPFMLQWPVTSLAGRPFWQRINLNLTLPTGRHGRPASLDLGSNAWQFNPHYAFTWEASPTWEVSGRLHYLWVGRNDDPSGESGLRHVQPGHALHLNAAVSRPLNENLRIGGSLYFLMQVGDDRIDGQRQPGRERVLGFGPSLSWKRGRSSFYASAYVETLAKDRMEGSRISLRYAVGF